MAATPAIITGVRTQTCPLFPSSVISSGMPKDPSQDLFPNVRNPENRRVINDRCLLRTQDAHSVVIVSGIVLAQYAETDHMAEAYAMVSLVEQGWLRTQW